ncbi:hypothetical protein EMIHUDRAFT_367927 [Emiliania huxleyi CCMP1516]|uniref:DUF7495 domain-containing protein n=2 Tax=Emiliania huxleyi TaxID=2903 RepID=A0A0D3JJQ0_EMIH1|nr:hypothetical protein EMIHUDRAFT_367927 [Emiliania huxleyi CCMP1516]EOD23735.1 hypothetical protein EMIHUDRAFT_367927 [Emiliania huxleyi CCMP1516]|eukprot:XP_005776164.1 hypothetical protein EMIHUDRAFT_367927 [Emiliania huxleyi CCMP1516]
MRSYSNSECITMSLFADSDSKNDIISFEIGGWGNILRIFPGDNRQTIGTITSYRTVQIEVTGGQARFSLDGTLKYTASVSETRGKVRFISGCTNQYVTNLQVSSPQVLYGHAANPGWNGKWDSARSFCQSKGGDLCDYAALCPGGRQIDSTFGQLSQDEWIPVKGPSVLKDYVQIGTRTSPRDDCCLISDDVCHGLRGRADWADAWGSRTYFQNHIGCCFTV